jgi:NADH:ubiquinone oxidoreductase subunit K
VPFRAPRKIRNATEGVPYRSRIEETMNLLTQPIGVSHYLVVGAILFVAGAVCMATKRNALGVLMGIELVLNGANLNFVAFSSKFLRSDSQLSIGLDGQLIALFVIVLAAAEAAVALAITLNFYNNHNTVDVDRADELKG